MGELVPRDDQPTTYARRKQKVYQDILGRTFKTEVYNWDGNAVYTTTKQTFNGRDQVTSATQYQGTDTSSTYQTVSMTYDGHGRLKTQHNPIEDSNTNTTWIYNADDTIQQIIDPRGANTTFTYNDPRGLLTKIEYSVPTNSNIPDPSDVTFQYDAAGNRTQMNDGTGSTIYSYDGLSRLTSETKTFAGLTGNFTIGYSYQLSGKLKSITDPFGATVTYNDDFAGRTTSITGSGFSNVATYADNIKYRAFGGIKELTYGSADNSQISYGFDDRLRVSSYQSTSSVLPDGYVRQATYEYFDDGRIEKVNNLLDSGFDRTYKFDQMGRLTENEFGMKANNQNQQVRVYSQSIAYNAFSEMTSRQTTYWGQSGNGFTASYVNGRKQNSNYIYDAMGNIIDATQSPTVYDRYKYDAAGRLTESVTRYYQGSPQQTSFDRTNTITNDFDGDGKLVKRVDTKVSQQVYPPNQPPYTIQEIEYFVHSSVLGKVLTELDGQGAKKVTKVYTGEAVLAEQRVSGSSSEVHWRHEDIITGSYQKIKADGNNANSSLPPASTEFEPLGAIVAQSDPSLMDDELGGSLSPANYRYGGDIYRPETGCEIDGSPIPCNLLLTTLRGFNTVGVQARTQGVEGGRGDLGAISSVWRFNLYQAIDIEDENLTRRAYEAGGIYDSLDRIGNTNFYGRLIGSWLQAFITPFGNLLLSKKESRKNAPLSKKNIKKITEAVDALKTFEPSEDCQKNVLDKLSKIGFNLEKFQDYLSKGFNAYDGTKSDVLAAGNIRNQKEADSLYGIGVTVADLFKIEVKIKVIQGKIVRNRTKRNAIASITAEQFTAYFRPSAISGGNKGKALIFHEALHGFLTKARTDPDIQRALDIPETGSSNITDYIKKYCFD